MNKQQEQRMKKAYTTTYHLLHHFNEKIGPAFSYSLTSMINSYPGRYLNDEEKLTLFALINVAYDAVPAGLYVAYDSDDLYKAVGKRCDVDKVVASLVSKRFIRLGTLKDGSVFIDVPPSIFVRAVLRVPGKWHMKVLKEYRQF